MESIVHGLPVITGPQWPGVRYFCTTRLGGVGISPHDTLNLGLRADDHLETVLENRRRVRAAVPADPLWLRQVHGTDVVDRELLPTKADQGDEPDADASVTQTLGRVLAIMVADCLPVFMTDLDGTVIGAAHAGWRGLAGGVLENTLDQLHRKAPAARGWRAWVGPGIGPDYFEIGRAHV